MSYKINVGDHIPKFKARDQNEHEYTDEDIIGGPLVLFFYPKDETPGCTKEACSFKDNMKTLETFNALVIGVSPDSASSHRGFIRNQSLNFSLFADEKKELCQKFDVLHEKEIDGKKILKFERTTFLIDAVGIIRWIERPVNVEGHTERIIEALKKLL